MANDDYKSIRTMSASISRAALYTVAIRHSYIESSSSSISSSSSKGGRQQNQSQWPSLE